MKSVLKKQVDMLINSSTFAKFAIIEEFEGREHFRSLVSLSPAMLHHPSSSKSFKQKGPKDLFVDETIEESNYDQPKGLSYSYERQNHSDTILNSIENYPNKSKLTNNKTKGDIICHM